MERTACPLCGCRSRRPVYWKQRDKYLCALGMRGAVRFVICRTCGLVYQNPRLDADELARLYANCYRSDRAGLTLRPSRAYLNKKRLRARQKLEWIGRYLDLTRAPGRALEIGAAEGSLLAELKGKGWQAAGVEPDASYARFGSAHYGIDIRVDVFRAADWQDKPFDLVIVDNVLEHIPDPVSFCRGVAGILKPGGHLYVAVPDAYHPQGILADFMSAPHLCIYSHQTLGWTVAHAGLDLRTHENHMGSLKAVCRKEGEPVDAIDVRCDAREVRRVWWTIRRYDWWERVRTLLKDIPGLHRALAPVTFRHRRARSSPYAMATRGDKELYYRSCQPSGVSSQQETEPES